jgi:hypothetical protein
MLPFDAIPEPDAVGGLMLAAAIAIVFVVTIAIVITVVILRRKAAQR